MSIFLPVSRRCTRPKIRSLSIGSWRPSCWWVHRGENWFAFVERTLGGGSIHEQLPAPVSLQRLSSPPSLLAVLLALITVKCSGRHRARVNAVTAATSQPSGRHSAGGRETKRGGEASESRATNRWRREAEFMDWCCWCVSAWKIPHWGWRRRNNEEKMNGDSDC